MSQFSQLLPDFLEQADDGPIEKPGLRNTTPSETKVFAEDGSNPIPKRAFVRLTAV
jgi:hypothetical protein